MSLELIHRVSETEQYHDIEPITDEVLQKVFEVQPDLTEDDLVSTLSGLRMAGLGYAEVELIYEENRMQAGALEKLHDDYIKKVQMHIPIPAEVEAELDDGVYDDILDEQAEIMRNKAKENVSKFELPDMITIEDVSPNEETLHQHQLDVLNAEIRMQQDKLNAAELTIIELQARLREAGLDDGHADSGNFEQLGNEIAVSIGSAALRHADV
ncbi:MAG: hypothetical protein JWM07_496 [Candidatus Saccharibacteria bacterium]|nr:hypothetical protein [Candidatus Saccharibacteria bacterium]